MYKSASRREHTPELDTYLFNRISSFFKTAGFAADVDGAGLSFVHFLNGLSSFLKGFLKFDPDADFSFGLFLSNAPFFEKDDFLLFLLPLFPPCLFILKNFYKDNRIFSIFTISFKL